MKTNIVFTVLALFISVCVLVKIFQPINQIKGFILTDNFKQVLSKNQNPSTPETQTQRQERMKEFCEHYKYDSTKLKYEDNFFYSDPQELVYCRVPKVACTTWKKVMAYFQGYVDSPYNVSLSKLYSLNLKYLKEFVSIPGELERRKESYYSFTFSRHPYDRLFSAYRNKFLDPHPKSTYYLERLGPQILEGEKKPCPTRKQDNLYSISFKQFVKFVLRKGPDFDDHWRPQTSICHICNYQFTFLGKFESFNQDSERIFKDLSVTVKLPRMSDYKQKTVDMLKKYYDNLPKNLLSEVFEFYRDDFEAFGYDPNQYF